MKETEYKIYLTFLKARRLLWSCLEAPVLQKPFNCRPFHTKEARFFTWRRRYFCFPTVSDLAFDFYNQFNGGTITSKYTKDEYLFYGIYLLCHIVYCNWKFADMLVRHRPAWSPIDCDYSYSINLVFLVHIGYFFKQYGDILKLARS